MTAPSAPNPASAQTVLQFTDLENPQDVAVDAEGNVYVADLHQFKDDKGFPDATTRVIKLAAGSDTPVVLPQFVHAGLMADSAGAVWVKDAGNDRLVKLAAGSDRETQQPLPSAGAAMSWRGGLTPSGRRDWPRAASPPFAARGLFYEDVVRKRDGHA